jgi:hypothetical protein
MADSKSSSVVKKDNNNDLGVPMLKGSSDEPTGPEDALGEGPKRGDYTDRIGPSNYHPHEATVNDKGVTVLEPQRPRAEDIGEVAGKKGGVDSAS